jgi:predicted ATPase
MAGGSGGQMLLSQVSAALVRDDLPSSVTLNDLGEHRLRDLGVPVRIYQLVVPGMPHEFPPLKSLTTYRHNLPVQLTSFIGRETELIEAKRLLHTTRLLTLTGPGGTGKTRFSLQLAADVMDKYPAGAWLVELAPLTDPSMVLPTVASSPELRELPGQALMDSLVNYLRGKTLLLILDNCEHLIEACAQIASRLLSACPGLTILPSSREALGVAGETAFRLPSLSLPAADASTVESFLQSEAVRLFVERARSAQPQFALTQQNLSAVAQICLRLDGIPLALELAAARAKLFSKALI